MFVLVNGDCDRRSQRMGKRVFEYSLMEFSFKVPQVVNETPIKDTIFKPYRRIQKAEIAITDILIYFYL